MPKTFMGALVKCNTVQKLDGAAQFVRDCTLGNLIMIVSVMDLGRFFWKFKIYGLKLIEFGKSKVYCTVLFWGPKILIRVEKAT